MLMLKGILRVQVYTMAMFMLIELCQGQAQIAICSW